MSGVFATSEKKSKTASNNASLEIVKIVKYEVEDSRWACDRVDQAGKESILSK